MVDTKSRRKMQQQLWVDKEFISWLKKLKAKKELDGEEIPNLGELTRQMVHTPALTELEKQMLKDENIANIRIKLDARRLFQ